MKECNRFLLCEKFSESNLCVEIKCVECPFNDDKSIEKLFEAIRNKTLTIN